MRARHPETSLVPAWPAHPDTPAHRMSDFPDTSNTTKSSCRPEYATRPRGRCRCRAVAVPKNEAHQAKADRVDGLGRYHVSHRERVVEKVAHEEASQDPYQRHCQWGRSGQIGRLPDLRLAIPKIPKPAMMIGNASQRSVRPRVWRGWWRGNRTSEKASPTKTLSTPRRLRRTQFAPIGHMCSLVADVESSPVSPKMLSSGRYQADNSRVVTASAEIPPTHSCKRRVEVGMPWSPVPFGFQLIQPLVSTAFATLDNRLFLSATTALSGGAMVAIKKTWSPFV